jgi:hypothetical protein
MTTYIRRHLRHVLNLGLVAGLGATLAVSGCTKEAPSGGWVTTEPGLGYHAKPPHIANPYTTADLQDLGFTNCVALDDADEGHLYAAHVVELPNGHMQRMSQPEVARRIEVFGGTPRTSDDVEIHGSCD